MQTCAASLSGRLLQRGRAQLSAEFTGVTNGVDVTWTTLQRGRAQLSAELGVLSVVCYPGFGSFNGAALN